MWATVIAPTSAVRAISRPRSLVICEVMRVGFSCVFFGRRDFHIGACFAGLENKNVPAPGKNMKHEMMPHSGFYGKFSLFQNRFENIITVIPSNGCRHKTTIFGMLLDRKIEEMQQSSGEHDWNRYNQNYNCLFDHSNRAVRVHTSRLVNSSGVFAVSRRCRTSGSRSRFTSTAMSWRYSLIR